MSEVLGQGIEFENAYSTGPSSSMSYIGMLSSKYAIFPDEKDTICKPNINRNRTLLYEIMKNNGFKTCVIANTIFHRYYGYDKGVDLLIDRRKKSGRNKLKDIMFLKGKSIFKVGKRVPYFSAKEVTEIVKDIAKKQMYNKIFIHINYLDTHTPPNISNEYILRNFSKEEILSAKLGIEEISLIREVMDKAEENGKELQRVKNKLATYSQIYYYEALYAAENINRMLNYLKKTGELKDTILIFNSDHGEYLWPEGKLLGHGLPIKNKEDVLNVFYDNLIHVPLILWGIGQKKIDKMVSLVDLPPTILEMIGIEKPTEWYGDSLFSEKEKPVVSEDVRHGYSCYSIRTNEWVFAYNEETKQEYLYKRSPEEKQDLSSEKPEVVKQMHELLENHKNKKKECWREYLKKDLKNVLKKGK